MGQLITVVEKPSARHGVIRFELNRAVTGMGHERFTSADQAHGERPSDLIARLLFAQGGVEGVHVHGNQVTVQLANGASTTGMAERLSDMFIYYKPGVVPSIP